MDLLIPDNWLKEFLDSKVTAKELQQYLSLSGPTVDRVSGSGKETVYEKLLYEIEVTTNRPDAMSVYGIAREAATILPRYGIKAALKHIKTNSKQELSNKVSYIELKIDKTLAPRSAAILLRDVTIKDSPKYIQERLIAVGERPKNIVVDVTNYIMHELGQPLHAFDYDKITDHKMIMRKSKKGETITTLDGKEYKLPEGGIVIEDGSGRLIDMPGIMGGLNTAVDKDTKNVLLFVQTYNSDLIRKMAMSLDKWSNAARLYEKGLDTELVEIATRRAIDLLVENANAKPEKSILDIYVSKPMLNEITIPKSYIDSILGVTITQKEITDILQKLGFTVSWKENTLQVTPPTYRISDIKIPEDIIEEIARIYGYQNIPGKLMEGALPAPIEDSPFQFESKVKNILKGLGGSEVYTLSLIDKKNAGNDALGLSNPLGGDTEFLRTSLKPSLLSALDENKHWQDKIHLFEMANVYIPQNKDLPLEKMTLAGVFRGYDFREAKGIINGLIEELNIEQFDISKILSTVIGSEDFYYEIDVEELRSKSSPYPTFKPLPQFPPQVEDITLVIESNIRIGQVIDKMQSSAKEISNIELIDTYENAYTFRVWFQDPKKTLTNDEVEMARGKMLSEVEERFGVITKN